MSTPSIPTLLRQAHRLRRHLRELKSEIDLAPRVVKIAEGTLATAKQAHAAAHDAIQKLKLKIREDEVSLKQANTQLAKFEKQLNDAGAPKEYEGKQSEIRQAKEKVAGFEEAILAGMEELDRRTADVPNVEKKWADAQATFKQFQADQKEQLETLAADQKASAAELVKTDAQFPPLMKGQYDRLIKAYGPDGMAPVTATDACGQCRTGLGQQQRAEIAAGKFVCCSTCGRALYLDAAIKAVRADDE